MTCELCERMKNDALFVSDAFAVLLPKKVFLPGHLILAPRKHHVILEELSAEELSVLFGAANKISSLLFDSLQAHGTNLLVRNGIPAGQDVGHIVIDIIPRWKTDNLNLQWPPQQLPADVFEKSFSRLTAELEGNIPGHKPKEETYVMDESGGITTEEQPSPEQDIPDSQSLPEDTPTDKQAKNTPWKPPQDNRLRHLLRLP
ncbi:MAG: HIT family protein [archaeon]